MRARWTIVAFAVGAFTQADDRDLVINIALQPDHRVEVAVHNPTTSAIADPGLTLLLSKPLGGSGGGAALKLPEPGVFPGKSLRFLVDPRELGWCNGQFDAKGKCVLKSLAEIAPPGVYQLVVVMGKEEPVSPVVRYEVLPKEK